MNAIMEQEQARPEVDKKFRDIDRRLEDLRGRRQRTESELNRLAKEENRMIRVFAEADGREKAEIRGRIDAIASDRTDHEREMAGLASAIAEAEQERTALLPEFEAQWKMRSEAERKRKLEELRRVHNKNLEHVRDCDKALLAAREAAEKSFFAWTTFKDQEALNEQLAAFANH
jgi:chromosome segregation ATPase